MAEKGLDYGQGVVLMPIEIFAEVFTGLAVGALAFVQWHISRRDESERRKQEDAARDLQQEKEEAAKNLQREQEKVDRARQRDADMAVWGGLVIDLMAELETACYPLAASSAYGAEDFDRLGTRASALVDRGRLYFPNVRSGPDQKEDEGTRVEILDYVLRACYLARHVAANGPGDDPFLLRHQIWHGRRRFVTLLQSEMPHSLRDVTHDSKGAHVPMDPGLWSKPTRPLKLPLLAKRPSKQAI